MSELSTISLVGGPSSGNFAKVRPDCKNLCVPFQYARREGDRLVWLTAVYLPHDEKTAKFDRVIQWADNQYVTPMDVTLVVDILRTIGKNGTLLELGSGTSSYWMNREHNILSIEDNPQFYGLFTPWQQNLFCRRTGQFYDRDMLKRLLVGVQYDALLVDGPDGDERMDAWLKHYDLFNMSCALYFDDYGLLGFADSIKEFAERINRPLEVHDDCAKHWAVVRRS